VFGFGHHIRTKSAIMVQCGRPAGGADGRVACASGGQFQDGKPMQKEALVNLLVEGVLVY
jgi:hypothetical protein